MDKQNIAYSILELAIVSQGDTIKQTLNNALTLAKEAEVLDILTSISTAPSNVNFYF